MRVKVNRRWLAFALLLAAYIGLTLGVIHRSPLLRLDTDVLRWDWRRNHPEWFPAVHTYVMLGQRAPSTLVAVPWFLWRAWRTRSIRGPVMLATALVVLNLSVGVVKIWTGRLGPLATHHAYAPFEGGNIFPSGHVSNAVVLYGVLAMLAVSYRRLAAALAAIVAVTVGLCTLYLDTHWFTDVLGGWLAGALVLLVLPSLSGPVERWVDAAGRAVLAGLRRRAAKGQRNETPVSSSDLVHSCAATAGSPAAFDQPTRVGAPRTSPIPSGP
jgi:undecaprenyl-diphosphatase